ncbi:hypothetical protein Tco_1083894, partial [Tanacetum coccineum]
SCYRIANFGVGDNGGKFPLINHKYKVNLFKNTSVTRLPIIDNNPCGFKFELFPNFHIRQFAASDVVDLIGTVVSISDFITYNNSGEDKIRRNLILEDVEGRKMDCCFFDGWAAKFDNLYLNREKMGQLVMILQLAKVKYFNEKPSLCIMRNLTVLCMQKYTKFIASTDRLTWDVKGATVRQQKLRTANLRPVLLRTGGSRSINGTARRNTQEQNGRGPFCFRIQGENNHVIGDLVPKQGETPKFGQLYIFDPANEVQNIINVVRYAGRKLATGDQNVKIRLLGSRSHDGRQYNLTTANEVATLIVGDFDSMPDERDIIVHENSGNLKTIGELHVSYLPLQYPLLFLYVEDGYRTDIYHKGITDDTPIHKKKYVTMREWFAYRIQDRPNIFSTILNGRIFFQQFLVDGYTMVEAERLRYIRNQNKELRCETYSRLAQAAESNNPNKKKHGTVSLWT